MHRVSFLCDTWPLSNAGTYGYGEFKTWLCVCLPQQLQYSWADLSFSTGQPHLRKHLLSVRSSCFFPQELFNYYKILFLARQDDNLLPFKEKNPKQQCDAVEPGSQDNEQRGSVVWNGPPSTEESHLFLICVKEDKCKHKTSCTLNCLGWNCDGRGQICGFGDWIWFFSYSLCHHSQGRNISTSGALHVKTQRKYHPITSFTCVRERKCNLYFLSNLLLGNSLHIAWIWLWLCISKGDSGKFGYSIERLFNWKFSRG